MIFSFKDHATTLIYTLSLHDALPIFLGPMAILGQYFNIRAYSLAKVSVLAPLSYASLLFAALIGWLFFSEIPSVDRKSTRLNSSHVRISYAVFCLKKKN